MVIQKIFRINIRVSKFLETPLPAQHGVPKDRASYGCIIRFIRILYGVFHVYVVLVINLLHTK